MDELVSRPESLDLLGPGTAANVGSVCAFDDASAPDLTVAEPLAVYRLAFGQHRQDELVEFQGADRSDADDLLLLA